MKYILFILILISNLLNITFASSKQKSECAQINEANRQLDPWVQSALRGGYSIGCPTGSVEAAISELEGLSRAESKCKDEAGGTLLAFFTIFDSLPDYKVCGFSQRTEALLAYLLSDGQVCNPKDVKCFTKTTITIGHLKNRGALKEAFILAKKTADSNDPTGDSQLYLGLMYELGEGTEKNINLAIVWLKMALKKMNHDQSIFPVKVVEPELTLNSATGHLEMTAIMALSVAYEEIHNYKSAEEYAQLCAVMGDVNCKNGLNRLRKTSHF